MSRIFVTGVAGFLGSHVADEMLEDGHEVIGVDNMIGGDPVNVPGAVEFYEEDCCEFDQMRSLMASVDIVFHCAATAYEGLSVFSPALVTQNIVQASTSVFSAAIANKVKRIVHCSSMARYGALVPPFDERMPCRPQDPYGIGKLCAEQMLINLCQTHGTEYVIAVPHNIIGPRQKYDDPFRNVASIMINRVLQGKPPIVYGDGMQKRCFSYIDDVLSCLHTMAFSKKVVGHVINIGPDEESVTINELASLVMELTATTFVPLHVPGRPQEVKNALCSSDKARELLGYETKTTLADGLTEMIHFIRARGPKPFVYHLPIEIVSDKTPKTWTDRLF
jgi:UDP-glucose 4-epimerase